jgi:hypothetical protein
MPIINQVVSGGGTTPTTRYGLNDKAWAGDLVTDSGGGVTMRTDQAVGTLTGLSTVTNISMCFRGSVGLVGAVDLRSAQGGDLVEAFSGTRITSLDLRSRYFAGGSSLLYVCKDATALTNVNLSDLHDLGHDNDQGGVGICGSFEGCTSLRELRLPSLRLDSWYWQYNEDEETGDGGYDYTSGMYYSLNGVIQGCSNLVVHLSSSLGEDLQILDGSDHTDYFLDILCGHDQATKASCSLVFDLPANDPFYARFNPYYRLCQRKPSADTGTSLAWWHGSRDNVVYTSGLTAPQVGDTIYSDPDCTIAVSTVDAFEPVYVYVEPEPEEEGGEEEPEE